LTALPSNFVSKENKEDFYSIVKEILATFGQIFVSRPYFSIIDMAGTIHYIDQPLEQFSEFIQNFTKDNFNLLNVGDHSLPLGGINLGFFKISPKTMIIIHTQKGPSGQLLSFKVKMFEWAPRIDKLIGDISTVVSRVQIAESSEEGEPGVLPETLSKEKVAGLKTVPVLIKNLSGKEKFPIEEAEILQFCDGKHAVETICTETGYPRLKVDEIIRRYQKKKWIEIRRVIL
jgi:hypothetical protein